MSRILPDWYDAYLTREERQEPPKLYKKWVAVSTIAAALQRKCYMTMETRLYPNLYTVLVGPAGRTRKGTAMGPGIELIRENGFPITADSCTKEAVIRRMCSRKQELPDPRTGEIYRHCSITVFSPELAVFIKEGDEAFIKYLADWYDCRDPWEYETISRKLERVDGTWVNLIGGTTPTLLHEDLPRDLIGGGLASRIIFVYAHKKGKLAAGRQAIYTDEEQRLFDLLTQDLGTIGNMIGEFEVTDEYYNLYEPWYEDSEKNPPFDDDYHLDSYLARRQTHLRKLSMIFSASRGNELVVAAEDFHRARALLLETEDRMQNVFMGYGANLGPLYHQLMRFLVLKGEVQFKHVVSKFYNDAPRDQLEDMIHTLTIMEKIEIVGKSTIKWIGKDDPFNREFYDG